MGRPMKNEEPRELIERCLNCTLPEKFCYGEKKCLAQHSMDKDALYQSVRYAGRRGMRVMDIAGTLNISESTVKNILNGRPLKTDPVKGGVRYK